MSWVGEAAINYSAIIDPIQTHPGAVLIGIAARSKQKAQAQIDKYKLAAAGTKAYGSYDELLNDPSIEAVYIPLPNGFHADWTKKALHAGKHVLVEKPFTNNADEARQVKEVAEKSGKVVLEAFHWRFHPAAHRVREIVQSGKYGAPTAIFAEMSIPGGALEKENIRYQYSLGGGASMDLTYVLSLSSYMASTDPSKAKATIVSATPRLHKTDPQVDEAMESHLVISPGDGKPDVHCHIKADLTLPPLFGFFPKLWKMKPFCSITLEHAQIDFVNFVLPTYGHSITITDKRTGEKTVETVYTDGPQWGKRGKRGEDVDES
ncbi:D-xylose 1-dehydrogenase (NADP(+)) 2 [Pseudocercospora fuligena]|uniref:D-xylose 1-dehydrogenase (NADP(+), D-xylono-1,5-lactone-forming) n=1 Tax=Pseudocercospora fuligena TaxID=685502 RepID=A0A8H6RN50_9PEZI|nr:D-xylose 1-dehydrogenase (NADP(+)) 2 [Pseudocercospora fuligena]